MNDFGAVDYKKPIKDADDMRTSTYRGHFHMRDEALGNKLHVRNTDTRVNVIDPFVDLGRISAMKSAYTWKFTDPDEVRNPALANGPPNVKNYAECELRFIRRPIRPARSVSHQDYLWNPVIPADPPRPIPLGSAVKVSQIEIDRTKLGTARLLDPNATTSRLDYVRYTPQQVMAGVGAHDNITFWNWKDIQAKRVFPGIDMDQCDALRSKDCKKRGNKSPSKVKYVPNAGLTTEVRSNYVMPATKEMEFDISSLRNKFVQSQVEPFTKDTEYKVYGSGKPTVKFV